MQKSRFDNINSNGKLNYKAGNFAWMQYAYQKAFSTLISSKINYSYFTLSTPYSQRFFILDGFEAIGGVLSPSTFAVLTNDPISGDLYYEICQYDGGIAVPNPLGLRNYWIYTQDLQVTSNLGVIPLDPQQFENVQNGIFHTNKKIFISATDPGASFVEKTQIANLLDLRENGIYNINDTSVTLDLQTIKAPISYKPLGNNSTYGIVNNGTNFIFKNFRIIFLTFNANSNNVISLVNNTFTFTNYIGNISLNPSGGTLTQINAMLELEVTTEISGSIDRQPLVSTFGLFKYYNGK